MLLNCNCYHAVYILLAKKLNCFVDNMHFNVTNLLTHVLNSTETD